MVRMESTALFVPLEVLRLAFWEGIIILSIFFCGGFGGTGVEVTGVGVGGFKLREVGEESLGIKIARRAYPIYSLKSYSRT